jgi:hypothetical protein
MDSSTINIFILLQIILAPLFYPYGYIAEFFFLIYLSYYYNSLTFSSFFSFREIDLQLLESLVFIFLLTNITFTAEISLTHYVTRICLILLYWSCSIRIQELMHQLLMMPSYNWLISTLSVLEILFMKQLYPYGYLSQLALIYYFYYNDVLSYHQKKWIRFHSSSSSQKQEQEQSSSFVTGGISGSSILVNQEGKEGEPSTSSAVVKEKKGGRKEKKSKTSIVFNGFLSLLKFIFSGSSQASTSSKPKLSSTVEVNHIPVVTGFFLIFSFFFFSSFQNEEAMVCKICFERFVDTVFVNCGHCCCGKCGESLFESANPHTAPSNRRFAEQNRVKCPFCQAPVAKKVELYFP